MRYNFHIALVLLALTLSGCSFNLGGGAGGKEYYVLQDLVEDVAQQEPLPYTILVRDARANRFYSSHKIVFSDDPAMRGYYQLASWADSPPKRWSLLLRKRLEHTNLFDNVTHQSSGIFSEFQLNTSIVEFYHDIDSRPGSAKIIIDAELVNLADRSVVATKEFKRTIEVKRYNVAGAVAGFSRGVSEILDEMIAWLNESLR